MKIFFYVKKINYLRVYSTLIQEAINRNYHVEICFDQNVVQLGDIEKQLIYERNKNKLVLKFFKSDFDIVNYLTLNTDIDIYILIYPEKYLVDKKIINLVSNKVVLIMSGVDTVATYMHWHLMYQNNPLYIHTYKKYLFVWTDQFFNEQVNIVKRYGNKIEKKNMKYFSNSNIEIVQVGFNEINNNINELDKELIRQEFNIEKNKNILTYLPYPTSFDRPNKSWQAAYSGIYANYRYEGNKNSILNKLTVIVKYIYLYACVIVSPTSIFWIIKGYSEKKMIKSIKKFCEKNNLLFVIKKRNKHRLIDEGYNLADLIIDDRENNTYPTNYQKLLRISKLVMGYHSTAVFESVKMNVPFLNIESPNGHWQSNLVKQFFSVKKNSYLNYPKVVWNYKIKDILRNFEKMHLNNFQINSDYKKKYIEEFLNKKSNHNLDYLFNKLEKLKIENQ